MHVTHTTARQRWTAALVLVFLGIEARMASQLAFLGAAAFALLGSVLTLVIIRQPKPVPAAAEGGTELAAAGARKLSFHH